MDFAETDQCKLVLLGLSLAGNLVIPLMSLYGTEWRERGYGLWRIKHKEHLGARTLNDCARLACILDSYLTVYHILHASRLLLSKNISVKHIEQQDSFIFLCYDC
jgi:hypothetical protein